VNRVDAGLLVVVTSVFTLWMALSDTALLYVRPATRTWLTVAGAVLAIVGITLLVVGRRHRREAPHHGARVGWLLVLPVAVAIAVGSNPLGSYAAGRQNQSRLVPRGDFDLAEYLNAGSFGGQAPPLRLLDFVQASYDEENRQLLADTPVRLTGFVTEDDRAGGHEPAFLLTRFTIGCCAADAQAIFVRVPTGDVPAVESWVEVEGRLDLVHSPPPGDGLEPPVLEVAAIRAADRPDEVYEYP
jgi:uncharacterized repeat protein (TIGR03943 family)